MAARANEEPPAPESIRVKQTSLDLIRRLIPAHAPAFAVDVIPTADGHDVCEIESRGGKIVRRGNAGGAIGSALNRDLEESGHRAISWNSGDPLALRDLPPGTRRHIREIEPAWTRGQEPHPAEPRGDTIEVSRQLWVKCSADASGQTRSAAPN